MIGDVHTIRSVPLPPLQRTAENAVRLLAVVWLLFHFGLTAAYVMPPNPMSIALQPLLNATIGTYYSQNWQLFSPEPLTENYALYVRPLTDSQAAASSKDGLPLDGWFDITSPLLVRYQQNRFSAYDRLARPHINGILNWLSGGVSLAPWQQSCEMGDSKACTFYNNQLKLTRVEAGKILAKAASAFCKDMAQSCRGATHVALRAHEELPVPWSQRYTTSKPVSHDVDLGVYPIDSSVSSAGIYISRRP
jgi:hypothetical protein